jgi:hypothetical protein
MSRLRERVGLLHRSRIEREVRRQFDSLQKATSRGQRGKPSDARRLPPVFVMGCLSVVAAWVFGAML